MYEMEGPRDAPAAPARLQGWQPNPRLPCAARPTTGPWYPLQGPGFPAPARVGDLPGGPSSVVSAVLPAP